MSNGGGGSGTTQTQTTHTYSYVPGADPDTPAAFLRLGGYSDIEDTAGSLAGFYPRQFITDDGDKANTSGIVLACSGRLLVHAGDMAYIHSAGPMHIDTEKTLYVNADEDITINSLKTISILSAESQSITIKAGDGTGSLTMKGKKTTKQALGHDYEYVTEDTYKYFQANSYAITLGGAQAITCGTKLSIWAGASFTLNLALDVTVSAMTALLFYIIKIEFGALKIDLVRWKVEYKDGEMQMTNTMIKGGTLDTKIKVAKLDSLLTKIEQGTAKAATVTAGVLWEGVKSSAGTAWAFMPGVQSHL